MIFATALVVALGLASTAPVNDTQQALIGLAPDLAAMPEVSLTAYVVEGRNPRTIRQNMNRLRPRMASGESFDGLTRWQFASRWKTQNGQCVPETIEIKVTVSVTLPQLAQYDRLSRSDRQKWDRYYAALVQHETNHARIAITGSKMMQEELRKAGSCDGLDAMGQRLAEQVSAASQTYDTQTNHGRTEGAVFP